MPVTIIVFYIYSSKHTALQFYIYWRDCIKQSNYIEPQL